MKIFDKTYEILERKLDLHAKRHAVLSGNIANHETPNYRARELDFAGELERAVEGNKDEMALTRQGHVDIGGSSEAHIVLDPEAEVGPDGNSVDLDISMGKLMSNARTYGSTVNLLSSKFQILRLVLGSRGGS